MKFVPFGTSEIRFAYEISLCDMKYAHGKPDFIAKLHSLKECYETEYWIELFQKAEIIDTDIAKEISNHCGTIRRILIASVNTAKKSGKTEKTTLSGGFTF